MRPGEINEVDEHEMKKERGRKKGTEGLPERGMPVPSPFSSTSSSLLEESLY